MDVRTKFRFIIYSRSFTNPDKKLWYVNTRKSMWRCDNVGGLGEHVTCHMIWFLRRSFFFLSLFLSFFILGIALRHRP